MKRVAVLTSGGDAPGMNAAVRSIVRAGLHRGYEMFGVQRGYAGLLDGAFIPLNARDVGGIIQAGGTILGSARSAEFATAVGVTKAIENIGKQNIDALVVIGGNGSQQGAYALHRTGARVVGVASTIDNDLFGSDVTIGVDTALNIALEAIDRLKVTASSHRRGLLVETMGRNCGYLALMAGIAGGAEAIVIPERELEPEAVASAIREAYERGKKHALIVVAEGARNNAQRILAFFREHEVRLEYDLRTTILGHVQRGGAPTASDRILATRLGVRAIDALAEGKHGVLVGWIDDKLALTPLSEVTAKPKPLDLSLLDFAALLSI